MDPNCGTCGGGGGSVRISPAAPHTESNASASSAVRITCTRSKPSARHHQARQPHGGPGALMLRPGGGAARPPTLLRLRRRCPGLRFRSGARLYQLYLWWGWWRLEQYARGAPPVKLGAWKGGGCPHHKALPR
ncbi:hypothetical protein TSOC_005212 [Tetrabaena socialis]|uniref:Uncharacterized protein n=1 Tax=Tetrabaena socialis TaxID=47790 RepID=A0A2J8A6T9_9CHLO|nr:hypothetical protein TSOC_005212 [Tetrabaena socialis]|eukprot:PNH08234.1 hypothetical protein TSOC_005212 [Tetrabaena socialis]